MKRTVESCRARSHEHSEETLRGGSRRDLRYGAGSRNVQSAVRRYVAWGNQADMAVGARTKIRADVWRSLRTHSKTSKNLEVETGFVSAENATTR